MNGTPFGPALRSAGLHRRRLSRDAARKGVWASCKHDAWHYPAAKKQRFADSFYREDTLTCYRLCPTNTLCAHRCRLKVHWCSSHPAVRCRRYSKSREYHDGPIRLRREHPVALSKTEAVGQEQPQEGNRNATNAPIGRPQRKKDGIGGPTGAGCRRQGGRS